MKSLGMQIALYKFAYTRRGQNVARSKNGLSWFIMDTDKENVKNVVLCTCIGISISSEFSILKSRFKIGNLSM